MLDARATNGLVGLTATVLASGALVVAFALAGALGSTDRGGTLSWWVLCLVALFVPVLTTLTRAALRDTPLQAGAPTVAGAALLGLLPAVYSAAMLTWGTPIADFEPLLCGAGGASLILGALVVLVAGVALAPHLGVVLLARVQSTLALVAERAMSVLAALCVITASVLLAGLAPSLGRPAADAWVDSLPEVARLPAERIGGEGTRHLIGEGIVLTRRCPDAGTGDRCDEYQTAELQLSREADDTSAVQGPAGRADASAEQAVVVRRDAAHDLWIVRGHGHTWAFHDLDPITLTPARVADSIAAPRPLMLGGLIGSLLACLVLAYRVRVARTLLAIRHARAGVVVDGRIVFEDGQLPARAALSHAAAGGPALAPRAHTQASISYRSDGQRAATRVWSGSRADRVTRLRAQALAASTLALACAALTLAPLWVVGSSMLW